MKDFKLWDQQDSSSQLSEGLRQMWCSRQHLVFLQALYEQEFLPKRKR